jgi:hypothetical protein
MSAASARQAGTQAKNLIAKSLPGSRKANKVDLRRAELIGERIWRRWQKSPDQWQLKHVRWYLAQDQKDLSPGQLYRHWLTLRLLVQALGKFEQWEKQLRGAWVRPVCKKEQAPLKKTGRPVRRSD